MSDAATAARYRDKLVEALATIERLQSKLRERPAAGAGKPAEPIAIVGMACRFPGGADDPDGFWRVLADGVDTTREFPAERGDARAMYDEDPDAPGKSYVIRGAFLDRVDGFEPGLFGISPREAVGMDPQQRLTLEVSWEALENAGYAPDSLEGSKTGVFLGVSTTDYVRMRQEIGDPDDVDAYQLIGEPSFMAGRVSFTLGLEGPSKVVDTACSGSLVAVHDACHALRDGEADMALAGGVNMLLSPYGFLLMSKFRALSPDGRCKTFDASANGYARGEGAGVVVLKRLSDAVRDGDHVLAVIRGSAVNHDGRSSGITVPNPASQQSVIRAALAQGGVEPTDVQYVEAHGTGTSLGDPIEVRSLDAVLRRGKQADPLMVGSVKTNIGHLESAAGIAGLIKLVLALQHEQVPPHLHVTELNPNVDWSSLNVEVTSGGKPWPRGERPRVGGISSFGASGTNSHAVLADPPPVRERGAGSSRYHAVTLSARTETALQASAERLAAHLREHPELELRDVAWTTHVGRARLANGVVAVGADTAEVAAALDDYVAGRRSTAVAASTMAHNTRRRTAWLFTGQGSQYAGMAAGLRDVPAFREAFDRVAAVIDPLLDRPLASVVWPEAGADEKLVDHTRYTQPALYAIQYALAQLWMSYGLRPGAVMGHSIGEIAAAVVAGVMTPEEGARLAAARGKLMGDLPEGGVMATLVCDEQTALGAIGDSDTVSVAAVNGPRDTVIAGPKDDVEAIAAKLAEQGSKSRLLNVSHAFHSPLMRPIADELRGVAAAVEYRRPRVTLVSNVTGQAVREGDIDADYWVRHALSAVRFQDGLRALHGDGFRTFLEIGPQPVLLGLGARAIDDPASQWTPSLRRGQDDAAMIAQAAGVLHLRGLDVDWTAVHDGDEPRRVPLPTYPWERQSFWFTPKAAPKGAAAQHGEAIAGLGSRLAVATPTYELDVTDERWAALTATGAPAPLSTLAELALAAARDACGGGWQSVADLELGPDPAFGADAETADERRQIVVDDLANGGGALRVLARTGAEDASGAPWRTVASGRVCRSAPAVADLDVTDDGTGIDIDDTALPAAVADVLDKVTAGPGGVAAAFTGPVSVGVALAAAEALASVAGPLDEPGAARAVGRLTARRDAAVTALRLRVAADGGGAVVDGELLDATGRLVARFEGLHVVATADLPRAAGEPWRDPAELLLASEWHRVDAPATPDVSGAAVLIVGDGRPAGAALRDALAAAGAEVSLVDRPALAADDRAPVAALLDGWARGDRAGHLVVMATDAPTGADVDAADLLRHRESIERLAVAAVQELAARGDTGVKAHLVTEGAQPAGDGDVASVAGGTLWGLARVFALEHPDVWGVAVDLEAGADADGSALAACLLASDEDEQALRGRERWASRLVPKPLDGRDLGRRVELRPDATYLVTGGLGGIGLALSSWLALAGAGRLVLTGRSGLPARETWDDADLPDATKQRIADVRAIEALGARVDVVGVDVTDADAMGRLVAELTGGELPLRGVVHAAGVSDPQFVRDVTDEVYARVWRPKVVGGWVLHTLTRDLDLDFYLSFSSIASTWGSQHLASYAAANAFLDGLAYHRAKRGARALTTNWGPWETASGLFGDDVMNFLKSVGLRPLRADQCLTLLGSLLAGDAPQAVVCAADWRQYKQVMEAKRERPMLRGIEIADEVATDGKPSAVLDELLSAEPDDQYAIVDHYVREQLSLILQLDIAQLQGEYHLLEVGLDSLMVMELISRCRKDLAIKFESRDFFATDANDWAGWLLDLVRTQHGSVETPAAA